MTRLAFDIYDPPTDPSLGTRRARLTGAELGPGSFYRHTLGGIGTVRIVLERGQSVLDASILRTGAYVVVRDLDLSATDTLNVVGGGSLLTGDFAVVEDPGRGVLEFGGPSTKALLADAIMGPESLSPFEGPYSIVDGYWRWGSDVYGGVLRRAILEANLQDPPGLPMIDIGVSGGVIVGNGLNWDDSGDSNGDPWPSFAGEFRTQAGSDLLSLATELYGYGVETDIDARTFDMYAYNAGGFGDDLTGGAFGAGVVRFVGGVNIGRRLERHIQGRLPLTHVLVRTTDHPEGAWIESDSYTPGDPVRKGVYQTGDISGDPSLSTALQERVQRMIDIRGLAEDGIEFHTIKPGDDAANGRYTPGPHYSPGATATAGHFWVGDYVTIHSGTSDVDYNNATKRVESITYEMGDAADDDDGGWNVIIGVGPRVGAGTTSGIPPISAIPLPFELCRATVFGTSELVTGRIYPSITGYTVSGLDETDLAAEWDEEHVGDFTQLFSTPHGSAGAAGSGHTWSGVAVPAAQIALFMGAIQLQDNAAVEAMVVNGGTLRGELPMRSRSGVGISEASQEHYPEWRAWLYRVGTGLVTEFFGVGDYTGTVKTVADTTFHGAAFEAPIPAYPSALGTDYLVIEAGHNHVGPTSGGTGGALRVQDSYSDDLVYGAQSPAIANGWFEASAIVPGDAGTPGAGLVDLVGTSTSIKRCDDTEHYVADRAPTALDDVDAGFRVNTLWHDSVAHATYWLVDNTAGAAVWLLIAQPAETVAQTLEIGEEDGTPLESFSRLLVPNGTLTDNGDGSASFDPGTGGGAGVTTLNPSSDTYIDQQNTTTNNDASTTLSIGNAFGAGSFLRSALLTFDISALAGKTIGSAIFSIVRTDAVSAATASLHLKARKVLRAYNPTQVTHNVYQTGSNWSTAGAQSLGNDVSTERYGSAHVPNNEQNAEVQIDIGRMLQQALDASETTLRVMLTWSVNTNSSNPMQFASIEHATTAYRPKLRVTHS